MFLYQFDSLKLVKKLPTNYTDYTNRKISEIREIRGQKKNMSKNNYPRITRIEKISGIGEIRGQINVISGK